MRVETFVLNVQRQTRKWNENVEKIRESFHEQTIETIRCTHYQEGEEEARRKRARVFIDTWRNAESLL